MPNPYRDEKGHWTTKENDGGPCKHEGGSNDSKTSEGSKSNKRFKLVVQNNDEMNDYVPTELSFDTEEEAQAAGEKWLDEHPESLAFDVNDSNNDFDNDYESEFEEGNNWNISDEDKEIFAEQIQDMNIDLNDISDVSYTDIKGYDGGYQVTFKDGSVKNYGWRDEDLDYTLYPVEDKLSKGAVTPGKRHSESNEYKHTVEPDYLVKAVNGNHKLASQLVDIAANDFEENLNNGTLDKNDTIKHWQDIANKLDSSKVSDSKLKDRIEHFKSVVNAQKTNPKSNMSYEEAKKVFKDKNGIDLTEDAYNTILEMFGKK